jgi:hypothetical protein
MSSSAATLNPAIPSAPGPAAPARRFHPWRAAHRWLPAVVVVVPTAVAVHRYGVSWRDLVEFAAYLVGCLALPGMLIWRAVRRRSGSLAEDVAPGLALGYAVEALSYLGARAAGAPLLVLAAPAGIVGAFLAVRRLRRYWRRDPDAAGPPTAWLWAMAVIVGVLMFWTCVAYLRTLGAEHSFSNGDLAFHLALIGEAKHHVPPQVPWVAGEPLQYHWYAYLHLASSSWITGIEPEILLLRLYHLPLIAGLPLLLGVAAHQLTGRWWVGPVAAATTWFGIGPELYNWPLASRYRFPGFGAVDDGSLLRQGLWVSVTQTFAAVICVPLVIVLINLLRGRDRGWRACALLVLLVGVMTGAKATYLPIILCGLLVAALVASVATRKVPYAALGAAALIVAGILFSQRVLLKGAAHGLVFDPLGSLRRTAWVAHATGLDDRSLSGPAMVELTAMTMLVWVLAWLGVAGLLVRQRWADPAYGLLVGMGTAGVAVVLIFSHYGHGQTWFLVAARPYLALAAAGGLAALLPVGRLDWPRVLGLLGAVAFGAGVAWYIRVIGAAVRPTVELIGEPAVLTAIGRPYLALTAATVVLAAGLWATRKRMARGFALALLVAAVGGYSIPASVAVLNRDVRRAAIQRFEQIDPSRNGMPAGVRTAARWLRDHSAPDDLVATNAHCRFRRVCQNLHFWFTAFTERRFLVEGWGFTAKANQWQEAERSPIFAPYWDPRRLADNDVVFHEPTQARVDLLRDGYGVRWLFVDETAGRVSPNLDRYARLRIRSGACAVYELSRPTDGG